jgi:mitochondrial fission protein ELM1
LPQRIGTPLERSPARGLHSTHAWTLSDGHAGNVRQAAALARALAVRVERDVTLSPGAAARAWAPRRWPGDGRAFGPDFARLLQAPPALAIGCGRQAALATRLLRARGARAVQILDPRIAPRHWDMVIAPEHDGLHGSNVVTLLGSLHPVDDAWLAEARAHFPGFAALASPRTSVLIGGDSRHARLDEAALAELLARLEADLSRSGGSVLLTTSRRTPPALLPMLRAFAARWPGLCWLGAEDGENPYPGLLAWANRIVCTADSVNMVSEACATAAPVFVFDPAGVQGRPRRFLDALLARGRIRPVDARLVVFEGVPLRETARVADEVRRRLGLQALADGVSRRSPTT